MILLCPETKAFATVPAQALLRGARAGELQLRTLSFEVLGHLVPGLVRTWVSTAQGAETAMAVLGAAWGTEKRATDRQMCQDVAGRLASQPSMFPSAWDSSASVLGNNRSPPFCVPCSPQGHSHWCL